MSQTGIDILLTAPMPPGVAEDLAERFLVHGPEVVESPASPNWPRASGGWRRVRRFR